jgi:hypothetical protein
METIDGGRTINVNPAILFAVPLSVECHAGTLAIPAHLGLPINGT